MPSLGQNFAVRCLQTCGFGLSNSLQTESIHSLAELWQGMNLTVNYKGQWSCLCKLKKKCIYIIRICVYSCKNIWTKNVLQWNWNVLSTSWGVHLRYVSKNCFDNTFCVSFSSTLKPVVIPIFRGLELEAKFCLPFFNIKNMNWIELNEIETVCREYPLFYCTLTLK